MSVLVFLASSVVIVLAAIKLAEYGDVIAYRTKLGGLFIGVLLMAGATSLPELLTTINSLNQNVPNLAAGNLFGSNTFNMMLLGVLAIQNLRVRILRLAAFKHALSGSLAIFISLLAVFFMVADLDIRLGWVGLDSLILILTYIASIWLLQASSRAPAAVQEDELDPDTPSLTKALIGFGFSTLALVFVVPFLVSSSSDIAESTGLGTSFIGITLLALVTSLPEMVTTIAAVRLGAHDLAIGNLFGSNLFNIFALGLTDLFYLPGRYLGIIDPGFVLVGMLGIVMMAMGLIGNLAKLERRLFFLEIDALLLFIVYFAGLFLIYQRGIGL